MPDVVLFDVSVADQISGPRQIEALVEQDPEISQQFSLWRTGGSDVWTGHLHVVPVGNRILYMEPVFLAAEADAIPELRRFVVSDGRRVAMTEQLSGAISQLAGFVIPESCPLRWNNLQKGFPRLWISLGLQTHSIYWKGLKPVLGRGIGVALEKRLKNSAYFWSN
ncbi:MAG: hypothetical protein Ct9H300mP15_15100 [Gemmatimonadota bacterium]|nr:MAG: hypothetical protein Ct9H300mP15_15100 [Gemmatimonadota bacterium]